MAPTVPIEFAGQKESKKRWLSRPVGKSRKYSKGHSSGFVPNYRDMTVSQDSFAPKRKCISLNADGFDSFNVPMKVLSLSKVSKSERKDLKLRVASLTTHAVKLPPSNDIRSCSDGQKGPPLEDLSRSTAASTLYSKKWAPSGRNGAKMEKGTYRRIEQTKLAAPVSASMAMLMKQCEALLKRLMTHQYGWVFNEPVDAIKLNIPDYYTVIKHPMDLGTVKSKIASGQYSNPVGFAADVRLTFSNAMKYNSPGNEVHIMAETLGKCFEVRWEAIEKKFPLVVEVESEQPVPGVHVETMVDMLPAKKKKTSQCENENISEPVRGVMNTEQKHKLGTELETLLGELPESVIEFLKEHFFSADQSGEDEIEIDIDALGDDTLFKLRKLLDDFLLQKQKYLEKAEPCEMELHNESGLSNSSLQPCKGNGSVDEDIDIIGGNDPPFSSHTPADIKDTSCRNSKSSGSNSSSGGSGSSSSYSHSGSSSGSDSDVDKASVPTQATQDNVQSGEIVAQKRNDLGDSSIQKKSLSELPQDELSSQGELITEGGHHKEAENALPDRQVSAVELYLAVEVRTRFADTILKAREKALAKGDKRDPEKLRMEREELERQQKEEKAWLQAEIKAAEEARRKAEAAAAVEAKRKRELEREAARQALLLMEKTVDINENSHFMKDFEMFRAAQDEQAPRFMEETSSDHSKNGLSSFKLQGRSNPLEQLGLYMKEEEEEEEEEEVEPPQSLPDSAKDIEEGEIG
ncbi:hypothetical protein K2173_026459 [Erythroxylum novogranatense]|uniref:Transcription factor GTE10-like n=1 Tax=Erythroxylum novogranatense TaxID=1862640 RepID=A0AAV8TWA7_9ROSI|nr:hypothetical protein K2173_026459 [Erythroxylum novogranatense]